MTVHPRFLRAKWATIMSRGSPTRDKKTVQLVGKDYYYFLKKDLSLLPLVSPDDIPVGAPGTEAGSRRVVCG